LTRSPPEDHINPIGMYISQNCEGKGRKTIIVSYKRKGGAKRDITVKNR